MTFEEHEKKLMRFFDGEMDTQERNEFKIHIESCETCRNMLQDMSALKEVTDSMRVADLPEVVWEKYWTGIYNRIERSIAWFLFIVGALILSVYWIYRVISDPKIYTVVGLGIVLMAVGFAVLFLSVLREKIVVNKADRYISEVDR
ncbi:zf-HC2 domain-containing protein [bacterium]|nr:zf-HC2 domain-containing protein [bacterium]